MQLAFRSTFDIGSATSSGVNGDHLDAPSRLDPTHARQSSQPAVVILRVFAFTLMVFPSNSVIRAIGAEGFVAALIGLFAFALLIASTLLGLHRPVEHRHPTRAAFVALWLVSLISYILMHRHPLTSTRSLSADRWLMQLAVISGVAMIAAECLRSLDDITRVLRAAVWGGAICGAVAGLQFWFRIDVTRYFRMLPGFTLNSNAMSIDTRGALNRVTGTAIHPIELGVASAMLVPLAIWLLMYDHDKAKWKRVVPLPFLLISVSASVSRSVDHRHRPQRRCPLGPVAGSATG